MCACSRAPYPRNDVSLLIESRIDKNVQWSQGEEPAIIKIAVCAWLKQDLTLDRAIEIALLNNPTIQAILADVGISYADLVQAGLLPNPFLEGFVRFPNHHGLKLNTEFSVMQNFLEILLIPLKKKIAFAELEKTKVHVAKQILDITFEVQEVYYALQAEQTKRELLLLGVDAAEASNKLAAGQLQKGNISSFESHLHAANYLDAKTELAHNEIEIIRLRERMNLLLGLSVYEQELRLACDLPDLPEKESSFKCLQELAFAMRLDLEAARWEVERIARMFKTTEWWAYTGATGGISTERDTEGPHVLGPAFACTIPIFNSGQADRLRLFSQYRQSLDRLKALELEVASEVRAARDRLLVCRQLVELYQKELLPLQEHIARESQKFYNVMGLSVYDLLRIKRGEIEQQIKAEMALKEYWLARVELDRAIGGNLIEANEGACDQ